MPLMSPPLGQVGTDPLVHEDVFDGSPGGEFQKTQTGSCYAHKQVDTCLTVDHYQKGGDNLRDTVVPIAVS